MREQGIPFRLRIKKAGEHKGLGVFAKELIPGDDYIVECELGCEERTHACACM